jgi:adenylate cyclase
MKTKIALFVTLAICSIFFLSATAWSAEKVPTPTSLEGGTLISAANAKVLVDKGGVAVFDMRKAMNFGKGHVPGAVSLPYKHKSAKAVDFDPAMDKVNFSKVPEDKSTALLFYSDGPNGWKSFKMAAQCISKGYTNVNWMREGMSTWVDAGYPVE